jgi:hypothetical protein
LDLTDSAAIGPGKTRRVRGRKYEARDCRGFYHAATEEAPCRATLIVDTTLRPVPRAILAVPAMREVVLAEALYHELGHHLDATVGAPARTGEAAAEAWSRRLVRQHFRERHRLFRAAARLLEPVVRRVSLWVAR